MTIRPSTAQDLSAWVRMRSALWPNCGTQRHELEIKQLTESNGAAIVLVAEREDGSLCGFAEVSIRHDHVDGAASVPVAYLEGWYVVPEMRGRGIGRKLLAAVESWAAERGLNELASDAELDNKRSIQAHVSCGFAETCRAVHFIKPIRFSSYLYILLALLLSAPHLSKSQEAGDGGFQSPLLSALKNELKQGNRSALERFWIEADGKAPLIERFPNADGLLLVTFIWRGGPEVSSVLLQGGPPTPAQKWLARLADTDLWFRTDPIPKDARFTYGYEVRTNQSIATEVEAVPDKLNHHSFDGRSFLELPSAPPQPWIERLPGVPQGKITLSKIQSKCLNVERDIGIYTPASYSPHGKPCNILIVFDGQAYRELMPLPVILDNLIAKAEISSTVAIGIPNPTHEIRQRDLHCYDPFADFVAKELIPWARKNYNISADPHRAVVAGSSAGGLTAAFCAFRYPKVFGNVLSQSGSFWYAPGQRDSVPDYLQDRGWLTRQFVSAPRLPLRFFIETGRFEFQAQVFDHHRIRDVLEAKGYPVIYREYNGGHDYFNWRGTFGDALIALLGKGSRAQP